MSDYHRPVLLEQVLEAAGGARRVVDATVGDGGHASALLAKPDVVLLGIDRDPDAIAVAGARLGPQAELLEARYRDPEALEAVRGCRPEFILLDLGVSSRQFDDPGRGFTFRPGAALDMRMGGQGQTAGDFINRAPVAELERVFADYGDEPRARRLAREVDRRRQRRPFEASDDVVNAIRAVLGPRSGPADFARIFQGIRIEINDELGGLEEALPAFRDALLPGGRLAVISYHSGEDRIVKRAFQTWAKACVCPPRHPICTCRGKPLGRATPRKPIVPTADEVAGNSRARSAKLRIFQVSDDEG